jgi:hypothetical protein
MKIGDSQCLEILNCFHIIWISMLRILGNEQAPRVVQDFGVGSMTVPRMVPSAASDSMI